MDEHNWWQVLFTEHYLETDYADITAERTAQEVDFLVAVLPITITDTILDLACGYGRHAVELARRGYTVTGFDYSRPFITKAKREAEAAQVSVRFIQGDMRHLPFQQEFDIVLLLFTSFGYFDDRDNQRVLQAIHQALKPQGKFLLDVVSAEATRKKFQEHGVPEANSPLLKIRQTQMLGPALVTEAEWFDPVQQKSHTHRAWVENGITQAYDFYLKMYSLDQYTSMLTQAGFLIRDHWGDFLGNPHNVGNSRTILVAEKLR